VGRGALRPDRFSDQGRLHGRGHCARVGFGRKKGAITASIYSTNEPVIEEAAKAFARAGVALSVNLTGGVYVNQSAAFSDYHVTGANPAGNACPDGFRLRRQSFPRCHGQASKSRLTS
jgi:hypothetical protein